jgi:hypothetical protein
VRNARPVTSNAVERGGVWLLSGSLSFGDRYIKKRGKVTQNAPHHLYHFYINYLVNMS